MKRIKLIVLSIVACIIFVSCDTYCTIVSFGVDSPQKRYYLVPVDSTMFENPFIYKDCQRTLVSKLYTLGYTQADSVSANLRIEWIFYVDAPRFSGTTSQTVSSIHGASNNSTTTNTNSSVSVSGTATTYGNTTKGTVSSYGNATTHSSSNSNTSAVGVSTTSTTAEYERPFGCMLMAYDAFSFEPIWRVEGSASISSIGKIPDLLKGIIIKSCERIGKNGSEEYWLNANSYKSN